MTRAEILSIVERDGYVCAAHPSVMNQESQSSIEALVNEGAIEPLSKHRGIHFMNESYFFILSGNPDKVGVKTDGNSSYLQKGML